MTITLIYKQVLGELQSLINGFSFFFSIVDCNNGDEKKLQIETIS
jgi:hypothetical protein